MRTFIACFLDWISGWLSCYADHIGSPDIYEDRLSIPLPGELWRSWKIQWQMWNAPVPDDLVDDGDWEYWPEADLPPKALKALVDQITDNEPTPDWRERMRAL